jgi:hypothetical protein
MVSLRLGEMPGLLLAKRVNRLHPFLCFIMPLRQRQDAVQWNCKCPVGERSHGMVQNLVEIWALALDIRMGSGAS